MPKKKSTNSFPPLPHDQVAWMTFLVPLVIGLGVGYATSATTAPNVGIVLLLFWLTALCFFLARYPLLTIAKASNSESQGDSIYWSGIYISIALLGGITLLLTTQQWWLAVLGVFSSVSLGINLWLATRRMETSVASDWTLVLGSALSAPAGYIAIARSIDLVALMVYLLNVLFLGNIMYYFKFKVREQPRVTTAGSDRRARLLAARTPILYSLTAILIVAGLILGGWLPGLALVAMLVPLPKIVLGALERPVHVNVQHLGTIETLHSLVFLMIVLWAFRW
ncbi:MAG: YwiC-like family protein [Chloroflexi bacterium]|nr:YwiC-like family protein [Chloroflexota bacterium]